MSVTDINATVMLAVAGNKPNPGLRRPAIFVVAEQNPVRVSENENRAGMNWEDGQPQCHPDDKVTRHVSLA